MKQVVDRLSRKKILGELEKVNHKLLSKLILLKKTKSTNLIAKKSFSNNKENINAFFAEQQTHGKGRNNRSWISPYGKNIYFSLSWKTNLAMNQLDGLSLAVGVEVCNAINIILEDKISMKWPNDLLVKGEKIGGILIETSSSSSRETNVVIGVGINVFMNKEEGKEIDQLWASLDKFSKSQLDRNALAGKILNNLLSLTIKFRTKGFIGYKNSFERLNFLKNKTCKATSSSGLNLKGKVMGINDKGELLIRSTLETYNLRSGEVTIRELKK